MSLFRNYEVLEISNKKTIPYHPPNRPNPLKAAANKSNPLMATINKPNANLLEVPKASSNKSASTFEESIYIYQ